ncbi:SRPBCC family protein [Nocardioides islandensis]|uniref:SRPBCC family protein n=1 Tax=Nocardioides islandensis TaxID=433663 RepID=A0A930YEV1_9ACTN|nr:SRPBCC family protein [Nocardioides islandensis]MBF4765806.1 SRPBCC family protein [Nocardioides islandensis]
MTRTPTGRIEREGERLTLFVARTFEAPVEDVWAAITEPERLGRWLGTWTGDPATGRVSFRMGFEGDQASYEQMEIRECDPPHSLKVTSNVGPYVWYLDVALSEADGVTTLAFSQPELDHEDSLSVGPGWEYYLDRLVAVETGGVPPETADFERDYFPAMADHYRAQRDG